MTAFIVLVECDHLSGDLGGTIVGPFPDRGAAEHWHHQHIGVNTPRDGGVAESWFVDESSAESPAGYHERSGCES